MNSKGEGHGEEARSRVYEQGDGLQGMSHDVFGLGAAIGLLMQELDARWGVNQGETRATIKVRRVSGVVPTVPGRE